MEMYCLPYKHRFKSIVGVALVSLVSSTGRADNVPSPAPPAVDAAAIHGEDDREWVSDTRVFPWSAVGMVMMVYGPDAYVGTGAMIGRRLVLTCAHVVDTAERGRPDRIEFVPGASLGAEPFGRIKVVRVVPSPQWQQYYDDGYDLAILVLEEPVGDQTGHFPIAVQPDSFFRDCELQTAGYPTDLTIMQQYTAKGGSYGIDGNVILHSLDSQPGQSGSPIWYGDAADDTLRLVGLVEGSYFTTTPFGTLERGIGSRVNQTVANWIEEQLAANGDVSQGLYAPVEAVAKYSSQRSFCGTGLAPWMTLATVAWGLCLVSRWPTVAAWRARAGRSERRRRDPRGCSPDGLSGRRN